jgi:septal ring factor EnvC (AmiA/AmiB activator)
VEKGGIEEPSTGLGSNTQKLISTLESHNSTLTEQVRDLQKSLDQSQQLLAMQQKSLNTLAEQNQLLIETTQQKKPSFWQRLIGQKI